MKNKKIIVPALVLSLATAAFFIFRTYGRNPVLLDENDLVFFSKDGCPYCAQEQDFLDEFKKDYPQIKIKKLDIADAKNAGLLNKLYQKYQVPQDLQDFVPATFLEDKYFVGYDDTAKEGIKNYFSNQK